MDALALKLQSPADLVALPSAEAMKRHEAAVEFEGLLMSQMLQTMRKTVEPSGLFGENRQARSTYEYLLDQAVIQHSLKSGKGWGLAEKLEAAWKR